jgi:hypothetical protein
LGALCACAGEPPPVTVFSERDARSVLEPRRFGWLSSERETGALPSAVALGTRASGCVLLYLEFPELQPGRRLLRAELLLSSSGVTGDRVEIELSRSAEATGPLRLWSERPRKLYPSISAQVLVRAWPQRLDVTEILRVHDPSHGPLRLLVRAEPGEGAGVLIATGASGGVAPRLELYWQ